MNTKSYRPTFWKRLSDWLNPPTVMIVVSAIFFLLIVYLGEHAERAFRPEVYRAWVQQTGNPRSFTYPEWRALRRADILPQSPTPE